MTGIAGWLILMRRCACLVLLCLLLGGCRTHQANLASQTPAIEFTTVPMAEPGTPDKLSPIKGRAPRAQPGQRVVLYARAGNLWWVQPFADTPFTNIDSNFNWQSTTHPGTEYAALLVGPEFKPPATADTLPKKDIIAFAIVRGKPPIWQTWWFQSLCATAVLLAFFGLYRLRKRQLMRELNLRFEERLSERMRVAQELHDTLLQGVLSASMQLHVATDQLPAESPARPALDRILKLMGQVVDEGRNTVRGLRSPGDRGSDLENAFSRIQQEVAPGSQVNFRVLVEGTPLPLSPRIRDDIYRIGREALVNAFRHSRGSSVEMELEYALHHLRIIVRDNGCGIDSQILNSGRDGHWGLSGMRERAERIGARFKVWSRVDDGTEVELSVPGRIAFESYFPNPVSRWFGRFLHSGIRTGGEAPEGGSGERIQTNSRSQR